VERVHDRIAAARLGRVAGGQVHEHFPVDGVALEVARERGAVDPDALHLHRTGAGDGRGDLGLHLRADHDRAHSERDDDGDSGNRSPASHFHPP
jgi:hypothetical protein